MPSGDCHDEVKTKKHMRTVIALQRSLHARTVIMCMK